MEKKTDLIIGSHISLNSPDYYLGTVKTALGFSETAFMFYTGAPANSFRLPLERLKIEEGRKLLKENNFDENNIIIHAPYIINLSYKENLDNYNFAKSLLLNELNRAVAFNVNKVVLHPGSSKGLGFLKGKESLCLALNEIFATFKENVTICLETMAGKGFEIGRNFDEIASIIDGVEDKSRIGVCLDTCHINDAGYDLTDFDKILDEFDKGIGLDKLMVIHLNDSSNPISSHKDRHANIGRGTIGFAKLEAIAKNSRIQNVSKILETPYINGMAPYKKEIEMLRNGAYEENWMNSL